MSVCLCVRVSVCARVCLCACVSVCVCEGESVCICDGANVLTNTNISHTVQQMHNKHSITKKLKSKEALLLCFHIVCVCVCVCVCVSSTALVFYLMSCCGEIMSLSVCLIMLKWRLM